MLEDTLEIQVENKKELYAYQKGDIDAIFERMDAKPNSKVMDIFSKVSNEPQSNNQNSKYF